MHIILKIYDPKTHFMKELPNDTMQLLINTINVKHLFYIYANVM